MKRAGELEAMAKEMAGEGQDTVRLPPAKERALKSLLEMKRNGELERIAQDMADAQGALELKVAQFNDMASRLRRGLLDAKRTGELERIAEEMTQMLDTKAGTIRERLRKGLLRAHRAGELAELRDELDELDDVVPMLEQASERPRPLESNEPSSGSDGGDLRHSPSRARPHGALGAKRWSDMTTSSDSDHDARNLRRAAPALSSLNAVRDRSPSADSGTDGTDRGRSPSADSGREARASGLFKYQ